MRTIVPLLPFWQVLRWNDPEGFKFIEKEFPQNPTSKVIAMINDQDLMMDITKRWVDHVQPHLNINNE